MAGQLEIEAGDVVKIILQFFKENNLTQSYAALQSECQVRPSRAVVNGRTRPSSITRARAGPPPGVGCHTPKCNAQQRANPEPTNLPLHVSSAPRRMC